MLNDIQKFDRLPKKEYLFSIIIPSWNNLAYLKVCIDSLRRHSHFSHQIIVHLNEGKDGSLEWLEAQTDIDYMHSNQNIGICYPLNAARSLVKAPYVCYLNDDMYMLPDWDKHLYDEVQAIGHKAFILSSTMIEPYDTNNPCVLVKDYGQHIEDFEEERLLREFDQLHKADWQGSTWPPILLPLELWDLVGGMSIEFSPGLYSDPDLSMKLWQAGVRLFKGVGKSKVYHFGSKSTARRKMNAGKARFLSKWGLSSGDFNRRILKKGQAFDGVSADFDDRQLNSFYNKLKVILNIIRR